MKHITDQTKIMLDNAFFEYASFHDMISQYSGGAGLFDVSIKDLMDWLKNPFKHRKQLIQLSKYYYNKEGIVTDCYDLFNVLPILNFSIAYENQDKGGYARNKKLVDQFIKKIKPKKLARDTIFSVIEEGTCVWYNRKNKYIQILDNDQVHIEYMTNGKWQVMFDMDTLKGIKLEDGLEQFIASLPDEITLATYNLYKKDRKKYRYVPLDINKTHVFKLRGSRNEPYGLPYCIPALASIIHRDLLEKTEKALADRIINQIIIQKIGTMPSQDGKQQLPIPKPTVQEFHNNLKGLLQKKYNDKSSENASAAPLTVPSFVTIEELEVKMTTFPKDVWERIDRDIYKKLGFSMSLNMGGGNGQSFGSSTINVEKIYAIIFYIIEDIEEALNEYLSNVITNDIFNPNLRFSRETVLNKELQFKQAEALYLKGRGSLRDFVEASGRDFDHWLAQVIYENETLNLDERLPVHSTSFTDKGEGGRPSGEGKNENTDQSKGNNGNNNPDIS